MSYRYDILLKNGIVVDPGASTQILADIAIVDGKIAEIASNIDPTTAQEVIDVGGRYMLPGIIDLHVHISPRHGGACGHRMMAQAGITTAFDMSGPVDSIIKIAKESGVGLNIACIEGVRPEYTVKDTNPSEAELQELLDNSLQKGAIGLKLLGGHYPLAPEATARAISVANRNKAYVAFHVGTLRNGSNIDGFLEAVELAGDNCLHIAHVNSYCRGMVRPYMTETEEAINALERNPNIRSESYLSPMNGTSAKMINGIPESLQTRKLLIKGGFEATQHGFEEAVMAGWAQVNVEAGGIMVLATGKDAIAYWQQKETYCTVSFKVNPPEPRIRLVTAKRSSGGFVVDTISTDGGGIPRNTIVEMGLLLVKLQAMTMMEFAQKTSYNPARILGLKNKGHFTLGADADITVIDLNTQSAFMSLSNGQIIMYNGYVCGCGSNFITTEAGANYVRASGLQPIIVDLTESAFYNRNLLKAGDKW